MVFDCPEVVIKIKDIAAIYAMNDHVNPIPDAESLDEDLFTGSATENGIRRRESLYKIYPKDTDSLEDRRYRLQARENGRIPYTIRTLKQKLEILCGKDGYEVILENRKLTVKIGLIRKERFADTLKMLEEMVPLDILLECILKYNQHRLLSGFTHGELVAYTHGQLRNEVLK